MRVHMRVCVCENAHAYTYAYALVCLCECACVDFDPASPHSVLELVGGLGQPGRIHIFLVYRTGVFSACTLFEGKKHDLSMRL